MKLHKLKPCLVVVLTVIAGVLFINVPQCSASELSYSPIHQEKILIPGTTEDLTLTLAVPANAKEPTQYELEIRPFSVDDDNQTHLEAKGNYSDIVNWVEIPKDDIKGTLAPNEIKNINATIAVP